MMMMMTTTMVLMMMMMNTLSDITYRRCRSLKNVHTPVRGRNWNASMWGIRHNCPIPSKTSLLAMIHFSNNSQTLIVFFYFSLFSKLSQGRAHIEYAGYICFTFSFVQGRSQMGVQGCCPLQYLTCRHICQISMVLTNVVLL